MKYMLLTIFILLSANTQASDAGGRNSFPLEKEEEPHTPPSVILIEYLATGKMALGILSSAALIETPSQSRPQSSSEQSSALREE